MVIHYRFTHLSSRSVVDVVAEFGHVEVPRRLSGVQLLLAIEVLQTFMVCVDVQFNSY